MVACRPEVVCTRSPTRSDSCRSIVACMAFRWRREAKNMKAPMMTIRGRKLTSSMAARISFVCASGFRGGPARVQCVTSLPLTGPDLFPAPRRGRQEGHDGRLAGQGDNRDMDLIQTLRSTGSVREFTDQPVPDEVVSRILETPGSPPAAPTPRPGVVLVKSPDLRGALRDLYLPGWRDYLAMGAAGLRPWAPTNDPAAEQAALAAVPEAVAAAAGQGFAAALDRVPVLLVVFADHRAGRGRPRRTRYTFAGGASIYPFVWNILLAARAEGLGGVLTTMSIREEESVRGLLGAPRTGPWARWWHSGHPVRARGVCGAGRCRGSRLSTDSTVRRFPTHRNRRKSSCGDVIHYFAGEFRGLSVAGGPVATRLGSSPTEEMR